jgi:hypothetical protein
VIDRVRRSDTLAVTLWFLATRALVTVASFFGAAHPFHGYQGLGPVGPAPPTWLVPFVRWDAAFYLDLARNGYPPLTPSPVYHAAFFPLYPMVIRAADVALHETVIAAVLVSNICALVTALLLLRLAQSRTAAIFFLAAPGAHFLSFPYSESLFCLLVVGALLALKENRPLLAAALGALASATRPTGVVVAVALVVWAWQHREEYVRAITGLLAAGLSTIGLLAYARFCQQRYGDALYFAHLQSAWGRHASILGPLRAFAEFRFDPDYYLVSLAAIAGAVWMIRRSEAVWTASTWFLILVPLSTGSLKSMIRFQSANVPLFAGAAASLSGRARTIALVVSLLLLALETSLYSSGYAHN